MIPEEGYSPRSAIGRGCVKALLSDVLRVPYPLNALNKVQTWPHVIGLAFRLASIATGFHTASANCGYQSCHCTYRGTISITTVPMTAG